MASRLSRGFRPGRPSLITYLMAGYPDAERSLAALHVVADAGADLIELGVPYADQVADGPVIVSASTVARSAAGGAFGLTETLGLARRFVDERKASGRPRPPIALMCYVNPLMRMGYRRAAEAIARSGIEGIIIPDLPVDMAGTWLEASSDLLDTVFLAAPTSTDERLARIGRLSAGFVYCVSTTGITGERAALPAVLTETVARVRAATDLPVAVGFGISTPQQAAQVARVADGAVVGSALVRRQEDLAELRRFVARLADAVHAAREAVDLTANG